MNKKQTIAERTENAIRRYTARKMFQTAEKETYDAGRTFRTYTWGLSDIPFINAGTSKKPKYICGYIIEDKILDRYTPSESVDKLMTEFEEIFSSEALKGAENKGIPHNIAVHVERIYFASKDCGILHGSAEIYYEVKPELKKTLQTITRDF